jgi:hypothetical protein
MAHHPHGVSQPVKAGTRQARRTSQGGRRRAKAARRRGELPEPARGGLRRGNRHASHLPRDGHHGSERAERIGALPGNHGNDGPVDGLAHAEQDLSEPDAVSDRVMKARDDGRARRPIVKGHGRHHECGPQWSVPVQRHRTLLGREPLQRGDIGPLRQHDLDQVSRDVEFLVGRPAPGATSSFGTAGQNREAASRVLEPLEDVLVSRHACQHHDAVDDHEVVGPVHGQPERILRAHADPGHGSSPRLAMCPPRIRL